MDLKQLRSFVYVADLGSFTKAAAFLNITQPALSRQIRLLEEELGTRLFQRQPQGISLTTDGLILFDQASSVISGVEDIKQQFNRRSSRHTTTGVVSIGIPAPAARFVSSAFFSDMEASCPGISLRIVEGYSGLIHEWLLSGSVELAITYGPPRNRLFTNEPLVIETLFAVVPATEENRNKTSIELTDLARQPAILPHRPHVLRDLLDASGIAEWKIIETDAASIMLQNVAAGRGFTILPFAAVGTAVQAGVAVALPITNPALSWQVTLAYSNLRPLSEAAQLVADLIKNEVRQLILRGEWKSAMLPQEANRRTR